MQTKLTAKEVDYISDLMTLEESVCKKARAYSQNIKDSSVAEELKAVADNHEKRFNSLLSLLS